VTISIGGRPISKVLAEYATAVIVDGFAIVIDAASKDWSMTKEAWITLLVGSFGPPTAAYLRKLSGKDVTQIVDNATADPATRPIVESSLKLTSKSPY